MKYLHKNKKGFAAPLVIMLLLVVGVVGAGVYFLVDGSTKQAQNTNVQGAKEVEGNKSEDDEPSVQPSVQQKVADATRNTNINSMYQKLEEYHNVNGAYPQTFTAETFPGIDPESLLDPVGEDSVNILTAQEDEAAAETAVIEAVSEDSEGVASYAYAAFPAGCTTDCTGYVLGTFMVAEQSDGNNFVLRKGLNN